MLFSDRFLPAMSHCFPAMTTAAQQWTIVARLLIIATSFDALSPLQ
jgi:hypothetical protein